MYVGLFEMFKLGVGPSSSHTVGPMRAAARFATDLPDPANIARLRATLLGSLAWTGRGHASDIAVILGLTGAAPDTVKPDEVADQIAAIRAGGRLSLPGGQVVSFNPDQDIVFDTKSDAGEHPNALLLEAFEANGTCVAARRYYSVGGGFVRAEGEALGASDDHHVPYPFTHAADLLTLCDRHGLTIARLAWENEIALHPPNAVRAHLERIQAVMHGCIDRGCRLDGDLPGGLKVRRRARGIHEKLVRLRGRNMSHPHEIMDWVSVFAIAVNEENAAGGRVVTAPTNGAAGVIPAVLRYYRDFCPEYSADNADDFLLTAAAIGALFKLNASISGAEVGCQGEVGVACSMAAAGLCAALGGSNAQIENAAEIAMEHHLGMTCDPIAGLVQIPCIERNAFGAIKAINAASLALKGDGTHHVSLDQVIETMRQTGLDMQSKYKETSQGGLAVNAVNC